MDACLYGAALAFAVSQATLGDFVTFRTWGTMATPGYAVALVMTVYLRATTGPFSNLKADAPAKPAWRGLDRVRGWTAFVCALAVVVLPLAFMVHARGVIGPDFAQSEVVVIESAAAASVDGNQPFAVRFESEELDNRLPGIREHFPYFPLMLAFGLPSVVGPESMGDARLWFALFTGLTVWFTLRASGFNSHGRLRVWQVLVVVPPGALAMASGGDDLPVLALCLASVIALERGKPVVAALVIAVAALAKLTAWPFLLALTLALATIGHCRKAMFITLIPVALTVVILFALPGAMIDVLAYPLHLTELGSPADDPTLGTVAHLVTGNETSAVTWLCLGFAGFLVVVVVGLAKRLELVTSSHVAAKVCALAAITFCIVLVLSPAWRPGYAAYPLNAALWCLMLLSADMSRGIDGDADPGTGWAYLRHNVTSFRHRT